MRHTPHMRRGAVLLSGGRYWLLWDNDRLVPVLMPIAGQNLPRSRWDYLLAADQAPGMSRQRLMVRAGAAREIETYGMIVVTHLTEPAMAGVAALIRRASDSEAVERRYAMAAL